ncbi:HpcH/HpaI aldolase/citrate lyase family protein [Streptomyces coeruleorubidus]|uniref:HpcH/HpaI aldolase/citrate lyase family protein n=1 Tax=Streptomyces coeruleorubidus TaxID=116188 RepID=UPI001FCB356C|nr:CoA ester lyase [Streptomyces coeruleorubidus]
MRPIAAAPARMPGEGEACASAVGEAGPAVGGVARAPGMGEVRPVGTGVARAPGTGARQAASDVTRTSTTDKPRAATTDTPRTPSAHEPRFTSTGTNRPPATREPHPTTPPRPPLRSLLFVPGHRTDWLPKARAAGADAVVLDLEDAVPAPDKPLARARVAEALAEAAAEPAGGMALFVRVNPLGDWTAAEELRAVVRPGLAGVVLPKVHTAVDVRFADRLIGWCEHERGLPAGTTALVPLLESARALHDAYDIAAAAPRVAYAGALTAPGGDVERAVGYRWSPQGTETLALRSRVLLDVRAAGAPCPVTGLWTDIADLTGLRACAEQNRALGYEGMMAIHPTHVPVINEVFSPTPEELDHYTRLVAAVESAQRDGIGALTFEGRMVDEAMAETARVVLARHAHG